VTPSARALPPAVLLVALLLAGCGAEEPPVAAPAGIAGELHLLTLVRLQGHADAVPCDPQSAGPLAAAVAARDRLQADGRTAELLLVGDTLLASSEVPGFKPRDVAVRARADVALQALAAARPAAWVPGPTDLAGDAFEPVLVRCAELGVPVLMSNVIAPAHPQIRPYVVLQAGSVRVGLLGLLPPRVADLAGRAQDPEAEDKTRTLELPGASLVPPREAIERLAAELRARHGVHFVVALSNLGGKANGNLAGTPGLDILLGSTEAKARADRVFIQEGTATLNALPAGAELAHTMLRVVDGDLKLQDVAPAHLLPEQIARNEAELAKLYARYGTDDVDELARFVPPDLEESFRQRVALVAENREFLEIYGEYAGSAIDHYAEPLVRGEPGPVEALLAGQGAAIEAAFARAGLQAPPPPADDPTIPLPDACDACHPAQVAHWQGTAHARAHESLRARQRLRDPACLRCHAAAFGEPLGWSDPRFDAPLGGVTCWSCHATGVQHATRPRRAVDPSVTGATQSGEMSCERCHDGQRSPGFDRGQVLAAIACPPMDASEPALLLARQAALDHIAQRRASGQAEDSDTYLEARALMGLGRQGEALPLLEVVVDGNAGDTLLAIGIARLCDEHGASAQALEFMRRYLRQQTGDLAANWMYVNLLLNARDPTVRDPAQAVRHLALLLAADAAGAASSDSLDLRCLQVEALHASGDAASAGRLLETLLQDHAEDARLLALRARLAPR
jgi:hypothetical protein